MQVKIKLGNTFEAAYNGVVGELKTNLKSGGDYRHIVIVPDKFSLTLEKNILENLGLSGSVNIQIMSFTRFAASCLKGKLSRCLTPEGSVMLLQKVINKKKNSLKLYKTVCGTDGFAGEIYAALTLIRNSGVTTDDLRRSLPKIKQPILQRKVEDLITLYDGYLGELSETREDSSTRLETFAKEIQNLQDIPFTYVYVSDFYQFSCPQLNIISSLIENSAGVTIGLVEGEGENRRLYPAATLKQILLRTEVLGIKPALERCKAELSKEADFIGSKLYGYGAETLETTADYIELYEAGDVFSEVERLAGSIKKLVIENGFRYSDIAVIAGDMEAYAPVFHSVLKRFDVPYFLDKKRLLSEQTPVQFFTLAIDVHQNRLRQAEVLQFVKNPFFYFESDVTIDDVDDFENYVLKHNVNFSRFERPFDLENEGNLSAEKVRLRLLRLLPRFKREASAEEFVSDVNRLLKEADYFEKLENYAQFQNNIGEPFFAKITSQIAEKLTPIFDEITDTIGEEVFAFTDFYKILLSMLGTVKIALAPLYLDSVFVGEATESRFQKVKAIFVVGAISGKIPSDSGTRAVLSVKDEEFLEQADVKLLPNKRTSNLYELFYLIQLLARSTKKLSVSYPKMLFDVAVQPSSLVGQLKSSFTVNGKPLTVLSDGEQASLNKSERASYFAYKFGTVKNAYFELLGRLVSEAALPIEMKPYNAAFELLPKEYRDKLNRYLQSDELPRYIDGNGLFFKKSTTNISQLECYFNCPLRHFFRYGLQLLPRVDGRVKTTDAGTFMHAILENYFNKFVDGELSFEFSTEQTQLEAVRSVCGELLEIEPFKFFLEDKRQRQSLFRIAKESERICLDLTALQKNSKFRPFAIEAHFGEIKGDKFKPIELVVQGRSIKLTGYIDRMDVYKDAFYVIDYKTYNHDADVKSVFYGKAIQLIAYMGAISSVGYKPVGAYYQPVTTGYSKDVDRYKLTGFTVNDINTAFDLDKCLETEGTSKLFPICVKEKKEGAVLSIAKGNGLEPSDFSKMDAYVKKLMTVAAEEIASGYIEPRPFEESGFGEQSKCGYCDYISVCPYRERAEERKAVRIEMDDIRGAAFDERQDN